LYSNRYDPTFQDELMNIGALPLSFLNLVQLLIISLIGKENIHAGSIGIQRFLNRRFAESLRMDIYELFARQSMANASGQY
jgi:hypothetical protein